MTRTRVAFATLAMLGMSADIAAAQSTRVQSIAISVDAPARVGLPIWVHADLRGELMARYPYNSDPCYFGSNRLELKRDGQPLPPQRGEPSGGLGGRVEGSAAPPASPQNRLPLHLGFAIDKPGRYSVRWTVIGTDLAPGILAQSDWVDFDVTAVSPAAREAWLTQVLRAPPAEAGAVVGDYLPSLLAAASDPRVSQAVMDATYSSVPLIASCALGSMRVFPAAESVPLTIRALHGHGPNDRLAYFVSWHAHWFQDLREEIVRVAASSLTSDDDTVLIGALQLLNFAPHFDWANDAPLQDARRSLKIAAPKLIARSDEVAHRLAITLGGTRDPDVRPLLDEIAAKHPSAREQAQIAMRWIDKPPPQLHERAQPPLSDAMSRLESGDPAVRKTGAESLMELTRRSRQDQASVAAYLINDVIRQPQNVNVDTWRDAALILGRTQSPLASALTVYLERDGAAAALIESGEAAAGAVADVLKIGGPARRRLAAQVLGGIGGAEAHDALAAALTAESDATVKRAIQDALAHFGERGNTAQIR